MSHREVQDVLAAVFQVEVGLGSITALQQAVSVALESPVTEVVQYIRRQLMRYVDETPWRERAKRVWLWVKSTPLATAFRILHTRGAVSARSLLGAEVWTHL